MTLVQMLFTREAVIALAILGALATVFSTSLRASGRMPSEPARYLSWLGYGFMAASMLLFIAIGLRGAP